MYRYIVIAIGALIFLLIGVTAISFLRERSQVELALISTPSTSVSTPTALVTPPPVPTNQAEIAITPAPEEAVRGNTTVIYLPLLMVNVTQEISEEAP